jgi:small-conductance mechanosensitive channel
VKTTHILLGALVFYTLILIVGFMGDIIFPAFEADKEGVTFHGSRTIGLTLTNLSLLFLVIIVFIGLASASQKREGALSNELLWRRLLVGSALVMLFVGSLFASIYVLSKKIAVTKKGILYHSLVETKELQWSEVERTNGNFVPGSRLGLEGRGSYAWVDFITTNGETVHYSLRFMRGISELERIIVQEVD